MKPSLFDPEYSCDYMKWIGVFNTWEENNKLNNDKEIEKFQNKIIQDNDPAMAYYFANQIGYKNYLMQNLILASGSAKYGILFAKNIKNADIEAIQNMIFESKQIKYICKFGCFVSGADVKKIESMILSEKNLKKSAKWAHMFIKHVKGTDANKFKAIIIKSKKPRYLFELAKHLKKKSDIEAIQQLIIDSKSSTYIRIFAEKIKTSNIEKLEAAILETNNTEAIKKFAMYVKRSKMRSFIILF